MVIIHSFVLDGAEEECTESYDAWTVHVPVLLAESYSAVLKIF